MPDKVNTERYELAVVLRPELESDLEPIREKLAKVVRDAGGKVEKDATFKDSRRELMYKIKGETHGLYGFYELHLPADAPNKISAVLNITDEVLRYLLTKIDAKVEEYLAEESKRKESKSSDSSKE